MFVWGKQTISDTGFLIYCVGGGVLAYKIEEMVPGKLCVCLSSEDEPGVLYLTICVHTAIWIVFAGNM